MIRSARVPPEAPLRLPPEVNWLSLLAIFLVTAIMGLTYGLTLPLLALRLTDVGASQSVIGLITALEPFGVFCGTFFATRVMAWKGIQSIMVAAIASLICSVLLMPLWVAPLPWGILSFGLGIAGAMLWVTTETWVLTAAGEHYRSRVVAVYMMLLGSGLAGGPLLLSLIGVDGVRPFFLVALLLAVSSIPLLLAGKHIPVMPDQKPAAFSATFSRVPVLLCAAFISGYTDTALIALLPLYGIESGLPDSEAVFLLSLVFIGTLVLQFPLGMLGDRTEKTKLIFTCAIVFVVVPLLFPEILNAGPWLYAVLMLWGGASVGIYTLALSSLGDRFDPDVLAGANAAMVAVYTAGSVAGPLIGGFVMQTWGPDSFMLGLSGVTVPFFAFAVLRRFT